MNQSQRPPNPIVKANILSKWSFWWMKDILIRGLKGPLEDGDLYEHTKGVESKRLTKNLTKLWEEEKKEIDPSAINIIYRVYGSKFIPLSVIQSLLELTTQLLQPLFFGYLVSYFFPGQTDITTHNAYMYALGIIICTFLPIATNNAFIFYMYIIGMKIRIGFAGLMYRKCLKISKSASSDKLTSQAINIMSNDLVRFNYALVFLRLLFRGPLEAIFTGVLLFREIGLSGLLGLLLMFCFMPFQAWIAKKVTGYRKSFAEGTDARVKLMNEIIQGIQVIKMYAWEKSFAKVVAQLRITELKGLRGMSNIYATVLSLAVVSTLSVFLTLVSYTLLGGKVTAKQVFTVSCFFYKLEKSLLEMLPVAITFCSEAYVSANRLKDFLLEVDELSKTTRRRKSSLRLRRLSKAVDENGELITAFLPTIQEIVERKYYPDAENKSVELSNAFASWEKGNQDRKSIIRNFSLDIPENSLVGIVGQVGAGKSTLLNVLLGEVTLSQGMVTVNGLISYASQEPWLFEGTIQENIVFVEEFDEVRYEKVLEVCALNKDLEMLPGGDLTVIGERGVSLSGGQKARINLARAVYRDADIYLLDDPLSAVDNNVGKHIFEKCINEFLGGKIRILVTHQIQYLFDVDQLVLMDDGKCVAQGSYKELAESKQFQFLSQKKNEDGTDETLIDKATRRESKARSSSVHMEEAINTLIDQAEEKKEKAASGSVKLTVYSSYLKALESSIRTFLIVGLFLLGRVMLTGLDYFISRWVIWEENMSLVHENINNTLSQLNQTSPNATALHDENLQLLSDETAQRTKIIIFYSMFLTAALIVVVVKAFSFFNMCLQISLNLHDRLFRGVTRATMAFFKNNSSGRILNRFSKDVRTVDGDLPFAFYDVLNFIVNMSAIILIVSLKNYWLIIPAFVLMLILLLMRHVFVSTSRSVKRIEAISQSPVYSHINRTFQGLATIRAFDAEKALQREFHQYQNANTSSFYLFVAASRAFAFWSEIICFVFISAVILSCLLLHSSFSSGDVGFIILQILTIIHMCQWGIRQSSELENHMTSVERILEYAHTPSEPPLESAAKLKPADDWPNKGRIEFDNVKFRYSPNDSLIIKNLNLCIEPKEKIGIVGRTGAGKSSIIQSIFRLACNEGKITIDGVDIEEIGLHDLRSKISIIPQDAVLFSGTLRYNLDPFSTKSDSEIWKALENVELHSFVSDLNAGLSAQIYEGGANFSMGQKQLICLARAILRNNKILILDEATANVDLETDKLIQKTIRTKFAKCTVLTIAHRLDTVIDSDRILVMDKGEAVEFDEPHILLQKENGVFLKLVEQAGCETSALLKDIAEKVYNDKHVKEEPQT